MATPPHSSFRRTRSLGLGAFAAVAAAALASAGPAEAHSAATRHAAAFAFGAPGNAADVDRTISIKARDVNFDIATVTVKAGETVKFVVVNEGAADHEFTLGDAAEQAAHRREMLEMAGMDMSQSHHDANALYLKSGETKALVWKFGKAGQIEFGCNVPGHYEAGMKGTIAVQ